ncbi:17_t:CDS:10 [Ambispora gerdemannii]|uniref:17_t:CDS:1 n=1 Tax=Ambispora gerdemannii TaxID=144530 RepID=A0A9N9FZQ0_9GLOM|nr:17_t:CDS:10 [Ambispora gerdemannii]
MEVMQTHYEAFKRFLATHLREQAEGASSRAGARDKLTKLSKQQFQELSIDVYDELIRRTMGTNEGIVLRLLITLLRGLSCLPTREEFHPKRNQARQKLSTLPKNRFKDLASDVYYELDRRFPELKELNELNFQHNEKIPIPANLADGVTFQAPKSNTIVPEKGILKEEIIAYTIKKPTKYASPQSPKSRTQSQASSISDFGRRYIQSVSSEGSNKDRSRDTVNSQKSNKNEGLNTASLDSLMADIGNMFDHKMQNANLSSQMSFTPDVNRKETLNNSKLSNGNNSEQTQSDYQIRIASLENRIKELEAELLEKNNNLAANAKVRELEQQLETQRQINKQQASKLEDLEKEFSKLNDDHQQQQEVANDVRKEATTLLEEIGSLSKQNDELFLEKEQDAAQIKALKAEVDEWKNKFEKKKTELRNLKATSSFVKEPPKIDVLKDNLLTPDQDGGIDETRIISYQAAIDDLLRAGRSDAPTNVLLAMKSIVIACKSITEDVEAYEQRKSASLKPEDKDKLYSLKTKLSATLTNLMTAAKNHATGGGISPVSLLDAAASHLTETIVKLVKLIKLRRLDDSAAEYNEEFKKLSNNNLLSVETTSISSHSRSPTPASPTLRQNYKSDTDELQADTRLNGQTVEIEDAKKFLELKMETIVQSIQTLLSAIRSNIHGDDNVQDDINTISSIVSEVITKCRAAFSSPSGTSYKEQGEVILNSLESSVFSLDEIRSIIKTNIEEFRTNKALKQRLASASFQIAKSTKDLVGLMD